MPPTSFGHRFKNGVHGTQGLYPFRRIPLATHLGRCLENDTQDPRAIDAPGSFGAEKEAYFAKKFEPSSPAMAGYNCIGMVFASRRAVLHPSLVPQILEEDGYSLIVRVAKQHLAPADVKRLRLGDIVIYDSPQPRNASELEVSHAGVVIRFRRPPLDPNAGDLVEVLSKFSATTGEHIHPLEATAWWEGAGLEVVQTRIFRPRGAPPQRFQPAASNLLAVAQQAPAPNSCCKLCGGCT